MKIKSLRSVFVLIVAFQCLTAFSQTDSTAVKGNRHMVFVSGGSSIVCSKVYDIYSAANNGAGGDFMVGYDWIISRLGLGVGLLYDGFYTSRKLDNGAFAGYPPGYAKSTIFTNVIAPQFVIDIVRPTSKWAFSFKVGIGLATVSECLKLNGELTERHTRYGYATTLMAGAEYRINRHIGITASLAGFAENYGTYYDEIDFMYKVDAMGRISIDLGVKYRF